MSLNESSQKAWKHCIRLLLPALQLAPQNYLHDLRVRLAEEGILRAVRDRDNALLFDWIVRLLARQGISNHAADVFLSLHGSPTFTEISDLLAKDARCPRLRSYWSFAGCSYRRAALNCGTPHHRVGCPVTQIPARKGALAEAAFGLRLFIRDVCGGDFVGWIDARLAAAATGANVNSCADLMRAAILDPLVNIIGTGWKVWNMVLSELLLGADPERQRWVEVGATFVAVDSLVHAFLHRTGILHRLDAEHDYGLRCYGPSGCAAVIEEFARRIDAQVFSLSFPTYFPRWIQFAIWQFCAADGWNTCNANRIDDAAGCVQRFCPCYPNCARLSMKGVLTSA